MRISLLSVAALATVLLPVAAHATTFDFTIVSGANTVTGVFTSGPAVGGTYLVTAVSGNINGHPITLDPVNYYGENDNMVFLASPFFNLAGVAFTDGTLDYNIYAFGSVNLFCTSTFTDCQSGGDGNPATVTLVDPPDPNATPEPSSLILLGTGVLSLTGAARRKFRKA